MHENEVQQYIQNHTRYKQVKTHFTKLMLRPTRPENPHIIVHPSLEIRAVQYFPVCMSFKSLLFQQRFQALQCYLK